MTTTTISPEIKIADPSILHSFQADEEFNKIHETSKEANTSYEASRACLIAASRLSEEAKLPGVKGIVITTPSSRLHVFSLMASTGGSSNSRIFGLTTKPQVSLADAMAKIKPLLAP